jgi:hypothetical protein
VYQEYTGRRLGWGYKYATFVLAATAVDQTGAKVGRK